jgi:hypothetical protein
MCQEMNNNEKKSMFTGKLMSLAFAMLAYRSTHVTCICASAQHGLCKTLETHTPNRMENIKILA